MKTQNYIIEVNGEPMTGLKFESDGKANVHTGKVEDAIRYTKDEAHECVAAIGSDAEAVNIAE
ncbi:MAG: hypothetical protein WCL08_01095 [Verrucomicrobiota bacterium]